MKYKAKMILGGFMGNLVEAYDMSLCYYLSKQLTLFLLGSKQNNPSLILTLTFLGYLTKPLGALVLGLFSDKYGRKQVLMYSVIIMGLSTFLIGLIPNYQSLGYLSVLMFLTLRIVQSMALGSEYLNSAFFLVESGEVNERGFRGSWSPMGVKAGYLLGLIVVQATLYFGLNWRFPFFFALCTTLIAGFVRRLMPESLAYVLYYADKPKPKIKELCQASINFGKQYPFLFNYAFYSTFLSVGTGFFYFLYMPIHASTYSLIPYKMIILANLLSLITLSLFIPIFGWLSDKYDRLNMLMCAIAGLCILPYPYMNSMHENVVYFFMCQILMAIPCACYYGVSSVILADLFPLSIRCTVLSLIYSISAAFAAGLPPMLANYLTSKSTSANAPAYMMMLFALIMLFYTVQLKKSYQIGVNQYKSLINPAL